MIVKTQLESWVWGWVS